MSDFDKDDYLSDADDLNRLSHQDGPQGPDDGKATDGSVPVAGARGESDATDTSSAAASSAGGSAAQKAAGADTGAGAGDTAQTSAGTAQPGASQSGTARSDSAPSGDSAGAGNAAGAHDGTHAVDGSLTELGKAKKEAADYLEALQRERADFINYRHRTAREKDDYRRSGQEDVLKALLPALDNLDRMREHGKMTKEVEAIAKQLDHGFDSFHITKFGTKGEAFDPARHEAILHRTSPDVDSVQVDAVVESGYELGGKILRAAKVVVVSPQEKTDADHSGADKSQDDQAQRSADGPDGASGADASDGSAA